MVRLTAAWSPLRMFGVTFAFLTLSFVIIGGDLYFGPPLHETGDLAANALQINRAKHFAEIYGNYSRFGFQHPGPAFFYTYAGGELLFYDILHVTPAPHNAHLLTGIVLQAAFLGCALVLLARGAALNQWLFITAASAIALVHFSLADSPQFSIWPPTVLVLPFVCFLAAVIAVATGRVGALPVLVISGGFLVHSHVAQPLFVVPLTAAGYIASVWQSGCKPVAFIRRHSIPHLLALAVAVPLAIPLLLDVARGPESNLAAIVRALIGPRDVEDSHSIADVILYVAAFLGYPGRQPILELGRDWGMTYFAQHWPALAISTAFIGLGPLALWATRLRGRPPAVLLGSSRRFFVTYYAVLAASLMLAVAWTAIQRGPLFQFNSFFFFGLTFIAFLPLVLLASQLATRAIATAALLIAGVLIIVTISIYRLPGLLGEDPTGAALATNVREIVDELGIVDEAILLEFRGEHWPAAAGVALALERGGIEWYVDHNWALIFGPDNLYLPQPGDSRSVQRWRLEPPASNRPGQIVLSPVVAIYPPPESLSP